MRNLLNVKKIEHKLVPVHLVKGGQVTSTLKVSF